MKILQKGRRLDLWLAAEDDVEASEIEQLRRLLSDAERARADAYRRSADTRRSVLGRGLARLALAERIDCEPADVAIDADDRGRPYVDGIDLEFSISHTPGLVAVAVTEVAVGVDVEWTLRRTDRDLVARRWFHPDEVAELSAMDESESAARFFDLWTLKEAYAKALGLGLAIPLREIRFHLAPEPRLVERGEEVEGWTFRQFEPRSEHRGAIALQASAVDVESRWWPRPR